MSDHGAYRVFFVSLADDPDAHALSGDAFKLLCILRLSLPSTGLGAVYPLKLREQLRCDGDRLEELMRELEAPRTLTARGWIVRERNVVWVVDGLRDEVNLKPTHPKHAQHVRRQVAQIDARLSIVEAFKAHYGVWFGRVSEALPEAIESLSEASPKPSDSPPEGSDSEASPKAIESHLSSASASVSTRDTASSSSSSSADDSSRERLLSTVPDRAAWEGELSMATNGAYGARYKATPEHVETACRDYIANGHLARPNLAHFRSFLRRVVTAESDRAERAPKPKTPPRTPAGSNAGGSDYGRHFRE